MLLSLPPFLRCLQQSILALLGIAKFYPHWSEIALGLAFLLFIWSFPSLLEFFIEKEGILNFLQGLFYDVIRKE